MMQKDGCSFYTYLIFDIIVGAVLIALLKKFGLFLLILLVIFELILWAINWQNSKNENCQLTERELRREALHDYDYLPMSEESEKRWAAHTHPIFTKHYQNLELIEAQYSVCYNLRDFYSDRMEDLIKLCEIDIAMAEEFKNLLKKYNQPIPPSYSSFRRLAIILEKRSEYERAAQICAYAIKLGFTDNNEMYGRLARLLRKSGITMTADEYIKIENSTNQY